jgi:superfamily I DNA/RNA helicase
LRAIQQVFKRKNVDNNKLGYWCDQCVVGYPDEEAQVISADLRKAYGLLKGTMTDLDNFDAINATLETYSVLLEDDRCIPMFAKLDTFMREDETYLTFDEMLTWIVDKNIPMYKYNLVVVDESQDMNRLQIEILTRMLKPGGKIVIVGDPNQSIYAFRGADTSAMDRMKHIFGIPDANCLPLSITYRCAKNIVTEAQQFVPDIQAASWAVDGEVIRNSQKQYHATIDAMQPGDMGVCRVNARLVTAAMQLIRQGRKACVAGRDIGKNVQKLLELVAKKAKSKSLDTIMATLSKYMEEQQRKLLAQKKENQAQALADKCETLMVLIDGSDTYSDLENRIESIFTDETEGVVFSSIHQSKGLEATNVVILGPEINYYFRDKAINDVARGQEENLLYVAITRAKLRLIYQELPRKV